MRLGCTLRRVAALQLLARMLAGRLTQDVDSVLRDVQLWLTPPFASRAMPPPPTSPLKGSSSEATGREGDDADTPARAEGAVT